MDKTFGYGPEDIGSIPIQSVVSLVSNGSCKIRLQTFLRTNIMDMTVGRRG